MTTKLDLYRCEICGNLVQVILPGDGELVCCNQPMKFIEKQTQENHEVSEKHVPVFIQGDECIKKIQIGQNLHPMSEDHYIQFVNTVSEDDKCIILKYFSPGDTPIVEFNNDYKIKKAQAYCNIHGLWEGKND